MIRNQKMMCEKCDNELCKSYGDRGRCILNAHCPSCQIVYKKYKTHRPCFYRIRQGQNRGKLCCKPVNRNLYNEDDEPFCAQHRKYQYDMNHPNFLDDLPEDISEQLTLHYTPSVIRYDEQPDTLDSDKLQTEEPEAL